MKKIFLFITAVLLLSLFQNCGQFKMNDGADPTANLGSNTAPGLNIDPNAGSGPAPTSQPKDLSKATWRPISSVGSPTFAECPTAVWTGSRMIVSGGSRTEHLLYSYDPATDSWQNLSPTSAFGRPYMYGQGALVGDRLVTFDGGYFAPTSQCTTGWCYGGAFSSNLLTGDRTSFSINRPAGLNIPARFAAAGVQSGTMAYIFGGQSGSVATEALKDVVAYNLVTSGVSTLPDMPEPRGFANAAILRNKTYLWGGIRNRIDMIASVPYQPGALGFNYGLVFDMALQTWGSFGANSPLAMRASAAVVATDNQIIIWGGHINNDNFSDGAAFEPSTNTWKLLPTVGAPSPRGCSAAVWTGQELIVWGGRDQAGAMANGAILK